MPDYHYLIPQQQQGLEKNLEHTFLCDSVEEAEDCFVDAKERLLDVNNWNKYSRLPGIEFRLKDSRGKELHRHARRGDHIRMDSPGNGLGEEASFDWVAIEAMEYDDYPDIGLETFAMRLYPSVHPMINNETDSTYDLTDAATSTFVIQRSGKKLLATYHGRNESGDVEPNRAGEETAWLGLSDEQWVGLIRGIAEPGMVKR